VRKMIGLFLFLASAVSLAQTGNTFHVAEYMRGWNGARTVGDGVSRAMDSCSPDTAILCYIVIDPALSAYPQGTMPTLCARCRLADYRSGWPGGSTPVQKTGSGTGDRSTASPTYEEMEPSYLSYTVIVPVGKTMKIDWACSVKNNAASDTSYYVAIFDGSSAMPGGERVLTSYASRWLAVSGTVLLVGDGASHTFTLRFKTPGSTLYAANSSSTLSPVMVFTLESTN